MILIFSEPGDASTDYVIDWLNHYKASFTRINFVDVFNKKSSILYDLNDNILTINSLEIQLNNVKSIWLRKIGHFKNSDFLSSTQQSVNNDVLYDHLLGELNIFINTILKNIPLSAFWITNIHGLRFNKWEINKKAIEFGIKVPKTYISNDINLIQSLIESKDFITKPLKDPITFINGASSFSMYTKIVQQVDVKRMPRIIFPSVIQEKIEKVFEVRSFYLEGTFYSMAIFSQSTAESSVDYREVGHLNLNRRVPYKLESDLEKKLSQLASYLGINCGSFDLIKSHDGNMYFLEVNPNGQYGMVDQPCNYNLDRKIAELLISKNNDE